MRLLLLFLVVTPLYLSAAEKMRPLADAVSTMEKKSGEPDLSQFAYVGTRCAALYLSLSTYLKENGATEKDKALGQRYDATADEFLAVGLSFSRAIKMSDENFSERMKMLVAAYTQEIVEGKRLNNSAITAFIEADLTSTKTVYPTFHGLAEALKEKK